MKQKVNVFYDKETNILHLQAEKNETVKETIFCKIGIFIDFGENWKIVELQIHSAKELISKLKKEIIDNLSEIEKGNLDYSIKKDGMIVLNIEFEINKSKSPNLKIVIDKLQRSKLGLEIFEQIKKRSDQEIGDEVLKLDSREIDNILANKNILLKNPKGGLLAEMAEKRQAFFNVQDPWINQSTHGTSR